MSETGAAPAAEVPITRIRATRGWRFLDPGELWRYRELVYFFVWRDVKIRYKQTVIGAAWAVIQPFCVMVVFSIFLGRLGGIGFKDQSLPYPIAVYSALVLWTYFSSSVMQATHSLVAHQQMISKVYFPRIILPLSSVVSGLVDFVIAFVILVGMMFYYGISPAASMWAVPVFVLMSMVTAFGVGLWLSALNVQYRDVRYAVGFLIQLWLFAIPVAYPIELVPERWRALYGLNPMVGVIEGFRSAVLGRGLVWQPFLGVSAAMVVVVMVTGIFYFRKVERTFADVV